MPRADPVERAEKRAQLGGEPVLRADFVNAVKIAIFKNNGSGANEHTFLDANSDKYKGHVEMLLTDKGIRIRSTDRAEQVSTVPFANISSYVSLSDIAWSQDRYATEKEAQAEKDLATA